MLRHFSALFHARRDYHGQFVQGSISIGALIVKMQPLFGSGLFRKCSYKQRLANFFDTRGAVINPLVL